MQAKRDSNDPLASALDGVKIEIGLVVGFLTTFNAGDGDGGGGMASHLKIKWVSRTWVSLVERRLSYRGMIIIRGIEFT